MHISLRKTCHKTTAIDPIKFCILSAYSQIIIKEQGWCELSSDGDYRKGHYWAIFVSWKTNVEIYRLLELYQDFSEVMLLTNIILIFFHSSSLCFAPVVRWEFDWNSFFCRVFFLFEIVSFPREHKSTTMILLSFLFSFCLLFRLIYSFQQYSDIEIKWSRT